MGYYFEWDEYRNLIIATANGFTSYPNNCENSVVGYVGLDSYHVGIHDYFKYLKFGFSRSTDHLSMYIRRKLISREDGVALIKKSDGLYPSTYLGMKLEDILQKINMTVEEFNKICDNFTNRDIFQYDDDKKDFVRRPDGSPKLKVTIE